MDFGYVTLLTWYLFLGVIAIGAALISIHIVTKLLRETWGRVLVGIAFTGLLAVCASFFMRADEASQKARDFNDACRYAMDLALMHRLHSEQKSAFPPQRPDIEVRLLDACAQVKQDHWLARFGPSRMAGWPEMPGSGYRLDEELKLADKEADNIAVSLLEHPSSTKVRRKAFILTLGQPEADPRIGKVLDSYRRGERLEALGGLEARGDRVIDFGLAELYYSRRMYSHSLKMLESALGNEWTETGRVDRWWGFHLPFTKEDHLRFGYLFYQADQTDRALSEYRLAKGADRTPYDMAKEYANPPAPAAAAQ